MKRDKKTGRMPPKKRNDRAIMLARQRRHVRTGATGRTDFAQSLRMYRSRSKDVVVEHYPEKKFAYRTTCTECGIGMSYDKQTRRYIIG